MLEVGINTNCEAGKNYKNICKNIAKAGFKNVMIAFVRGQEEEQLKYAKKLGLNVCYVHLDHSVGNSKLWVHGKTHNAQMALMMSQIDLCFKYGVKIAVLHSSYGDPREKLAPPNEYGLSEFKRLMEYAKARGVKLALENVDDGSIGHIKYLLNNIKSSYFGFCYDSGHHNLYAKDLDLLKLYGKRLLAVHLHDNLGDYKPGDDYLRDLHYLPLDGTIDFASLMAKLKQVGYNNVVLLEVHKISANKTSIYSDLTPSQFLAKAHSVATTLRDMM